VVQWILRRRIHVDFDIDNDSDLDYFNRYIRGHYNRHSHDYWQCTD
jgi:hypothetical protein